MPWKCIIVGSFFVVAFDTVSLVFPKRNAWAMGGRVHSKVAWYIGGLLFKDFNSLDTVFPIPIL